LRTRIDRGDALRAERHRRDSLHAAKDIDFVGAAEVHRRDDGRMRAAAVRGRAGGDALYAGDTRRDDRHVRRGDHRIAAARHVAADRIHRDVAMAEDDARQGLNLEVAHRLLLLLREVADLGLRELDVVEVALGNLRDGLLNLGWRQTEILGLPVIKFLRQLTDRDVLLLLDLRQDVFDGLAHLLVRSLDRACVHSALEESGHEELLSQSSRRREGGDPVTTEFRSYRKDREYWMPAFAGMPAKYVTRDPGSRFQRVRDDRFAVT
jgi:hypothetical protein